MDIESNRAPHLYAPLRCCAVDADAVAVVARGVPHVPSLALAVRDLCLTTVVPFRCVLCYVHPLPSLAESTLLVGVTLPGGLTQVCRSL